MNNFSTDVAIIGAGPVGLFAVFECGMLKMKCHVIDALSDVGGQCTALYPKKPIYDIPGLPEVLAGDLIQNLETQIAPFHPTFHLGQQVVELEPLGKEGFRLKTSGDNVITAKAIIIAAGVGAFGPKKPPLENIEAFEEKSVFYYIKDPENFRGKRVVIAGGGDSAVDWALLLEEIAASVHVVHRRDKFRAAPENVQKMRELDATSSNFHLTVPYQLNSIRGENGVLKEVVLEDLDANELKISADVLLPFYGLSMNLGPIADWGLELSKKSLMVDPLTYETSQKGIFAIGDVCTYENKLKLILTGFSEAAQAAHQARSIVFPGEAFHFEYSTTQGVPGTS